MVDNLDWSFSSSYKIFVNLMSRLNREIILEQCDKPYF